MKGLNREQKIVEKEIEKVKKSDKELKKSKKREQ